MKYLFNKFIIILLFFITGCASLPDVSSRIKAADKIAFNNGFSKKLVRGGDFLFTTYSRILDNNLPFAFYIEKDGYAFTRYGISDNPTPTQQMLFLLASQDRKRNVVYIARPCQYTDFSLDATCSTSIYWTNKRMALEVVTGINEVIKTFSDKPFSIIGHSGGGGIAVLIADINKNVKDIVTIAANLDIVTFNDLHKVPGSMNGSLNPIDYAIKLKHIPQLHLAGQLDNIVPAIVINKFVEKSNSRCVKSRIIKNASHNSGWEASWESIIANVPSCN